MTWKIQPGDQVKVFPYATNDIFYYGIVRSMPQDTGDAWVIEDDAGVVTYQQTYNRIVRTGTAANVERLRKATTKA